jgi:hypothetical protein
MARQRRSGGFKPPELKGTLGTLLRTTLQQAGVVRDVAREALERGAREGKSRLDNFRSDLRSSRQRQEALAELGEIVLDLIRRGEIDLAELPEARDVLAHIEELDISADEAEADREQRDNVPTVPPPSRKRFDDRSRGSEDDGTVSSARWTPPARRPGKPTKVWKPSLVDHAPVSGDDQPPTNPGHKPIPRRDAQRKGGIQFSEPDDDSDLADYMHPDDVPKKSDD